MYTLENKNDTLVSVADSISGQRDTTRYMFMNGIYSKNKLVLAVVQKFVEMHRPLFYEQLLATFPKSLQGSKGVVAKYDNVKKFDDFGKKYFCKENQILHLDFDVVVCTQWGIFNIGNFIACAKQLGFL